MQTIEEILGIDKIIADKDRDIAEKERDIAEKDRIIAKLLEENAALKAAQ